MLEAISEFDPFLAKHIEHFSNPGKGSTSYLSFAIYEKNIKIMVDKVTETIIEQLQKAKYFSFSVDSTPDITHEDQLSLIVRFVQDNAEPVERFLCFLPNTGHKAEDMLQAILKTFDKLNIDIANCRGQSYDNASNMSGQYNGLQAKIKEKCQYATYIPCAAHSLNLIGSSAAECYPEATKFFGVLKNLYVFFTGSTERTKILQTFLMEPENVTVKSLSHTRWSARDDACSSLNKNWEQIIKALEAIKSNSSQQKAFIKNEATGLLAQLNSLETAILSEFWVSVLKQFNTVSKVLQGVDTNVEVVSNLYDSLITFVKNQRELFDAFEKAGKEKCTEDYKDSRKRITKRKKRDDEQREGEVILQGRDYFKVNTFLPICDQLLGELRRRKTSYDAVTAKFVFLSNLSTLSEAEIKLNALSLQKSYPTDLADDLKDECILLKNFLPSQGQETKTSLRELNLLINKKDLKVAFPYIEIALRIFLCTAVTNCSAECSFSNGSIRSPPYRPEVESTGPPHLGSPSPSEGHRDAHLNREVGAHTVHYVTTNYKANWPDAASTVNTFPVKTRPGKGKGEPPPRSAPGAVVRQLYTPAAPGSQLRGQDRPPARETSAGREGNRPQGMPTTFGHSAFSSDPRVKDAVLNSVRIVITINSEPNKRNNPNAFGIIELGLLRSPIAIAISSVSLRYALESLRTATGLCRSPPAVPFTAGIAVPAAHRASAAEITGPRASRPLRRGANGLDCSRCVGC
ncbi:unnamed protein product [Diatraea saccharalis]|uniref:DUF4371 domain-containing protein n=1 Tax=Diatraea saccharalis TaxID=40085 RepID=A0A9N9WD54_9NEOP|nr:unnamed protein product [Diatraea saccharalis]